MSAQPHALHRQMAVRIELHADDAARADDRAHTFDHVPFHVIVAVRNHGSVQSQQDAVQRQRGLYLRKDFVAHEFIIRAVGGAGGAGGEAASLDQGEAFRRGTAAVRRTAARCTSAAHLAGVRRAEEHALLVGGKRRSGSGENVLVSVAMVALNRRMQVSPTRWPAVIPWHRTPENTRMYRRRMPVLHHAVEPRSSNAAAGGPARAYVMRAGIDNATRTLVRV